MSCYWKVAGSIPLVCISKCPRHFGQKHLLNVTVDHCQSWNTSEGLHVDFDRCFWMAADLTFRPKVSVFEEL